MKRSIAYAIAAVIVFVACSDLTTQPEAQPEAQAEAAVIESAAMASSSVAPSSALLGVSTICQSYQKELERIDALYQELPSSETLRESHEVLTAIVADVCG